MIQFKEIWGSEFRPLISCNLIYERLEDQKLNTRHQSVLQNYLDDLERLVADLEHFDNSVERQMALYHLRSLLSFIKLDAGISEDEPTSQTFWRESKVRNLLFRLSELGAESLLVTRERS